MLNKYKITVCHELLYQNREGVRFSGKFEKQHHFLNSQCFYQVAARNNSDWRVVDANFESSRAPA